METVIPIIDSGGVLRIPINFKGFTGTEVKNMRMRFMNSKGKSSYSYSEWVKTHDDGSYSYESNWTCSVIKKNEYGSWNVRLYEEPSFDSANGYPFKMSVDKRHGAFNYEMAYEDAKLGENRVYPEDFYICTNYIPTSLVGYGTVQEIYTIRNYLINEDKNKYGIFDAPYLTEVANSYIDNYYILKIFPHAFHNWDMGTGELSEDYDSYYARYYIKINGIYYKILDWRYYLFAGRYDVGEKTYTNRSFNPSIDADGYGNPLAMYILIRKPDGESISSDDTYTIYCNYTDTDDYTFKYTDETVVSFYDATSPNSEMVFYKTQDEALKENNIYSTSYSNVNITGVYPQDGTYISKYKTTLYQVLSNNKLSVIDSVAYEFGQNIRYEYDEFMNGKKYLLHFEIANSNGNILNYYRCIVPSYGLETKLIRLDSSVNRTNNSVIIDYSNLFSIAPKEETKGCYEFIETDVKYQPYLNLYKDNSLTYDEIDGQGDLSISNPVSNIVIKLNSYFNGEICRTIDDDENVYVLKWDGIQFVYKTPNKELIYYPYKYGISDIESLEDNAWLSKMIENMESADINTDVPYVWNEAFDAQIFNSDLYIHTEEPASEYWWSIVMYDNGIYFKNLTIGSDWVNISSDKEVL